MISRTYSGLLIAFMLLLSISNAALINKIGKKQNGVMQEIVWVNELKDEKSEAEVEKLLEHNAEMIEKEFDYATELANLLLSTIENELIEDQYIEQQGETFNSFEDAKKIVGGFQRAEHLFFEELKKQEEKNDTISTEKKEEENQENDVTKTQVEVKGINISDNGVVRSWVKVDQKNIKTQNKSSDQHENKSVELPKNQETEVNQKDQENNNSKFLSDQNSNFNQQNTSKIDKTQSIQNKNNTEKEEIIKAQIPALKTITLNNTAKNQSPPLNTTNFNSEKQKTILKIPGMGLGPQISSSNNNNVNNDSRNNTFKMVALAAAIFGIGICIFIWKSPRKAALLKKYNKEQEAQSLFFEKYEKKEKNN